MVGYYSSFVFYIAFACIPLYIAVIVSCMVTVLSFRDIELKALSVSTLDGLFVFSEFKGWMLFFYRCFRWTVVDTYYLPWMLSFIFDTYCHICIHRWILSLLLGLYCLHCNLLCFALWYIVCLFFIFNTMAILYLIHQLIVWRAVDVTWQTATRSKHAAPCCDAEQQQDQASAAVVTLAANPRAHQTQSRHPDVQGSSDVITAVPKFAAERSHPTTDAPTFQHAVPDRAENAHWTCQASILRRCTFSVEQSAGRCCWH